MPELAKATARSTHPGELEVKTDQQICSRWRPAADAARQQPEHFDQPDDSPHIARLVHSHQLLSVDFYPRYSVAEMEAVHRSGLNRGVVHGPCYRPVHAHHTSA